MRRVLSALQAHMWPGLQLKAQGSEPGAGSAGRALTWRLWSSADLCLMQSQRRDPGRLRSKPSRQELHVMGLWRTATCRQGLPQTHNLRLRTTSCCRTATTRTARRRRSSRPLAGCARSGLLCVAAEPRAEWPLCAGSSHDAPAAADARRAAEGRRSQPCHAVCADAGHRRRGPVQLGRGARGGGSRVGSCRLTALLDRPSLFAATAVSWTQISSSTAFVRTSPAEHAGHAEPSSSLGAGLRPFATAAPARAL